MARNNGTKRLNAKQNTGNKSGLILVGTFAVWLLFLLDMIFVAHNNIFIIVVVTIGIWAVGLTIAKPGQFAAAASRDGFWKTLFGNGSNQSRRKRRR